MMRGTSMAEVAASVDLENEYHLQQFTTNVANNTVAEETAQVTTELSGCDADRNHPTTGRGVILVTNSTCTGRAHVVMPSLKDADSDENVFTELIEGTEKLPISPEKNQSNVDTDACEEDVSSVSNVELLRVIQSDIGVSRCASTAPVFHWSSSGDDGHEELFALGMFAKPVKTDDADDLAAAKDRNASLYTATEVGDGSEIKTTISRGSNSPLKDIETSITTSFKFGKILHIKPTSVTEDLAGASRRSRNSKVLPPISPSSHCSAGSGYDKNRLTDRLKHRLAQRNQNATVGPPTKSVEEGIPIPKPKRDIGRDRLNWETRIQTASRQKCRSAPRFKSQSSDDANSDIFSRYSQTSELDFRRMSYPDTVTYSGTEDEEPNLRVNTKARLCYRNCASEVNCRVSLSTRLGRSKHHSHHHRIGILQTDGIVYNDALLLGLAQQARYGHMRGEVVNSVASDAMGSDTGERSYNEVKIHIYNLLTNDSFVEVPYFKCNFPIGQCFKVMNDGCHVLGTGAYHVGVEVNGIEYAFGANNIIGMSGIFTCIPKESPGYEFRETLDFGRLHTSKRTWIRIPKSGQSDSNKTISCALGGSFHSTEKALDEKRARTMATKLFYSFREIESFADGHAIIHSMAREYMGTDYDLLRRNCCTFARDVCTRLGVKEEDIPKWFHNAAQAGADAEDIIANVENSVRNMLDCADGGDLLDMECYNHGFEVIIDEKGVTTFETATQ